MISLKRPSGARCSSASTALVTSSWFAMITGLLRADEARDLPGVAFLDVAQLLIAERQQLIGGDVAGLAGRQHDTDEVGALHRAGRRIVRIDAHQMEAELL